MSGEVMVRIAQHAEQASASATRLRQSIEGIHKLVQVMLEKYNPGWTFGPALKTGVGQLLLFIGRHKGESGIGIAWRPSEDKDAEFRNWLPYAGVELLTLAIEKIPDLLEAFDTACLARHAENEQAAQRADALVEMLGRRK